jgi:glycogen operon protein
MQDPVLSAVKLIAEPWDVGPGGYQVGGFPPGWAEWNDQFRDTVRSFWKGDQLMARELATRLCASPDRFNHHGRKPWASVNFVTAHDGFTLNDIATYDDKHNDANGEDNRDGNSNNHSWNCGVEGPTDDPEINALRERQIRNMMGTLLLSQGTPMLLAGDEFARTQGGNNNAYCQDNEISWLDWNFGERGQALIRFVQKLTRLRHDYPILRRGRFLGEAVNEELGVVDVSWVNAGGGAMSQQDWQDGNTRCFGMLVDGRAQATGIRRRGEDATMLIVFNAYHDVVDFALPPGEDGQSWLRLIDTNQPDDNADQSFPAGEVYQATGRSLLLFKLMPASAGADTRAAAR